MRRPAGASSAPRAGPSAAWSCRPPTRAGCSAGWRTRATRITPTSTWPRYVSSDAGETWQRIRLDFRGETIKTQGRENYATWSPTDRNVAWSIGGDFVVKSTDGGHTFRWSNAGYNGVMAGGAFNFNPHDPALVFVGFQDYDGAFTTDGGRTWTAPNVSGPGVGRARIRGICRKPERAVRG